MMLSDEFSDMNVSHHHIAAFASANHHAPHTGSIYPLTFKPGPTTEELQLAGACDWYRIDRLVHAENKLIHLLREDGLVHHADTLQSMRDDVLAHRMAGSPFGSASHFLRNHCGNDALIAKWRLDIDNFDRSLAKALVKKHVPPEYGIELRYLSQLLRQQARASLPFTGYYNPNPKMPKIPPNTYRDHVYKPRFELKSDVTVPPAPIISGFL